VLTSGVYPNLEDRHGQDGSGQYCTYTCLDAWVWTWIWAWASVGFAFGIIHKGVRYTHTLMRRFDIRFDVRTYAFMCARDDAGFQDSNVPPRKRR
jgi:hypothetical protein